MVAICLLLMVPTVWAQRSRRPATFTNLADPNQLTELNNTLSDFWHITNGRYTLENIVTNPDGTRKGLAGDLVYATFGSSDHLCINTSLRTDTTPLDWTCIDISVLDTCPGGFDGQIQFHDNGNCGGDAGLMWEKNTDLLTLTDSVSGGTNGGITFGEGAVTSYNIRTVNQTAANTSGDGLRIFLAAGLGTGDGGTFDITGGDGGTTSGRGTDITLLSGNGGGSGRGGNMLLESGNGGTTGAGGSATLESGAGGSGSGNGGDINLSAGSVTSGDAGSLNINMSSGVGTNKNGGSVYVALGKSTGSGGNGAFDIDRSNATGLTAEGDAFIIQNSSNGLADGTTLANWRHAQFLAPTLNGVAGGATETVTNAATVYVNGPPSGSNITFTNGPWGQWVDCTVDGDCLNLLLSNSQANTAGSSNETAQLRFGFGGNFKDVVRISGEKATGADFSGGTSTQYARLALSVMSNGTMLEHMRLSLGGIGMFRTVDPSDELELFGGMAILTSASTTSGDRVPNGSLFAENCITIDDDPDACSTEGTDLVIRTTSGSDSKGLLFDSEVAASSSGFIQFQTNTQNSGALEYQTIEGGIGTLVNSRNFTIYENDEADVIGENPLFVFGDPDHINGDLTTDSGRTITNQRFNFFAQPTINGIAGGGTETCTNCATVYIEAAPSGSNITFTNGPYALWVDAGIARFDGTVSMQSDAEVTGILTVFGDETVDGGSGTGQLTLDGNTGGCLMLRDDDDAGWTRCTALNGVLTCAIDADGAC